MTDIFNVQIMYCTILHPSPAGTCVVVTFPVFPVTYSMMPAGGLQHSEHVGLLVSAQIRHMNNKAGPTVMQ